MENSIFFLFRAFSYIPLKHDVLFIKIQHKKIFQADCLSVICLLPAASSQSMYN